ncbi:MAG: M23 family metallopeptidase [Muribaculaceae bacterium]|nr:M23 family metallopeptidase [Muribaculaceae bacterium]
MNFKMYRKVAALLLVALSTTGVGVYAQSKSKSSFHQKAHRNLIASQSRNKDKIKLLKESSFIDFNDNLEPELDIYTEGWNSRRVNPFNENEVPDRFVINVTNYVMPVPGHVTSNYGYRPKFGRMHKGVDLKLNSNDTVVAAFSGKVRVVNYEGNGYGNYVIIRHPNGLETVYGHLNKQLVKENQVVTAGQPIGLGGSTGRSTGPHLHFETRFMGYPINPAAIFDFANHCTHTDEYTFTKKTYTEARNYAPKR